MLNKYFYTGVLSDAIWAGIDSLIVVAMYLWFCTDHDTGMALALAVYMISVNVRIAKRNIIEEIRKGV